MACWGELAPAQRGWKMLPFRSSSGGPSSRVSTSGCGGSEPFCDVTNLLGGGIGGTRPGQMKPNERPPKPDSVLQAPSLAQKPPTGPASMISHPHHASYRERCSSACSTTTSASTRASTLATEASVVSNVEELLERDSEGEDMEDVQACGEYAADIFRTLGQHEAASMARPDYMDLQPDINAKMRAILVDWLVEVHMKYKLRVETLFLAVNLVDRFLGQRQIARKRLQLVGVTAMLIAAKFEEIHPPEIRDFVYITDKAYSREEIIHMEVSMLTSVDFVVCVPTAAHFYERYKKANKCSEMHSHFFQYILELTLPDIRMLRYTPSHLAAAACLLSNKLMRQHPSWPSAMVGKTKNSEQMVKACAKELCGLLEAAEGSQLRAVWKKFSLASHSGVSKMSFLP